MHARQFVLLSGQQVREGRGRTCRCIADDVVILQSFYLYDIVSRQMLGMTAHPYLVSCHREEVLWQLLENRALHFA